MNHHLHESAKKKSRKLATFCFILFLKENVYLFENISAETKQWFLLEYKLLSEWAKLLQVFQEILWLVKERAPRVTVFCSTGGNTTVKVKRE